MKEGVISDAEFWKPRQDLVVRRLAAGGSKQQVVGLRSALLAQLQPAADGKGKQVGSGSNIGRIEIQRESNSNICSFLLHSGSSLTVSLSMVFRLICIRHQSSLQQEEA